MTTRQRLPRPLVSGARRRNANLDMIRALAAFLVVSVHFFLNNGYYTQPLAGGRMLLMTMARMAFMTCVPLFLILTGYLCRRREFSPRYYLGLVRILITYLLCALWCMAASVRRGDLEIRNAWDILGRLLDFSADSYAWYIEMYIGLFLLIPFLNMIWKGLELRKKRMALIITLLGMTALPTVSNLPGLVEHTFQTPPHYSIIPDWWIILYPLTYYFLGAWFGEYQPKVNCLWGIPALAGTVAAGGGVLFWLLHGETFRWNTFNDWGGASVTASACLLFLLLRRIPAHRFPAWLQRIFFKGSELSLGIYLISWRFDSEFYPILAERVPNVIDRAPWYFVIVPAVYLSSALAAQGVEQVRKMITMGLNRLIPGLRLN